MLEAVRRHTLSLESGVEIALLEWEGAAAHGDDRPLALLHHANGFCAAVWGLVADELKRYYRVFAMDARGHGDSSKPKGEGLYHWTFFGQDVAAVAQRLCTEHGRDRIALGLGHSLGGTSILMASARRPELFERSVLVDPVIRPPAGDADNPEASSHVSSLAEGARNRREVWPDRAAARDKWRGKDLFTDWDPRALELYLAEGLRDRPDGRVELKCPGAVEAAVFEAGGAADLWALASKVVTPTLLLRAAGGNFSASLYENLIERMANGTLGVIEAGHLAVMERPDLVVECVLDYTGVASALDR
jgi:pimeloyl-ACP methyl ester carboxylesterase